jgi:hypothetical protein
MRRLKRVLGVCALFLMVAGGYAGHAVHRARQTVERYEKEFGYNTPTTDLPDCILEDREWKGIVIDADITYTDGAHNIQPFDIDRDGRLELVANSYRSDALMIYRLVPRPDGSPQWARHVVDAHVGGGLPRYPLVTATKARLRRALVNDYLEGAHYTAVSDLNGRGGVDLVVAEDQMRYDVVWYEAAAGCRARLQPWTKHIVYQNDSHRTYHVETGDIDGDGDQDIVFATKTDKSLGWLENAGVPSAWPATIVDANCVRCFRARVRDVDKDGRADIVGSEDDHSGRGGKLHLYAHAGHPSNAGDWQRYDLARFPRGRGISVFALLDLDGDGDDDVAAANHQGDVFVLRNPWPEPVRRPWEVFVVRAPGVDKRSDLREIDVGDIDLDGDPDIVVADETRNAVLWLENPGTTFCENWPEHRVDQSDVYLRWCHCVRLADMDHDGDLDIVVAAAASNVFLLYLNQRLPGHRGPAVGVSTLAPRAGEKGSR